MMRRVSSRQRLVSWDSFDAVQRELESIDGDNDDDEVSSFEDAAIGRKNSYYSYSHDGNSDSEEEGSPRSLKNTGRVTVTGAGSGYDEGDAAVVAELDVEVATAADGSQPMMFKRKRILRRKKSSSPTSPAKARSSSMTFPVTPGTSPPAGGDAVTVLLAGAAPPCLASQTDDVLVQLSTFLDLDGVRSLSQVNRRFRDVLRAEEYVWNVQATRVWTNVPMAQHEIVWETSREREDTSLSKLEHLALAKHQVPTKIDSSIFTPTRWTRPLRNRTIVLRGSIHKELELVPTDDPARPAVRLVGIPGRGDRSIRTDAPLPRPTRAAPQHPRGGSSSWRPAFFRRAAEPPSSLVPESVSATAVTPVSTFTAAAALSTSAKWQPFVVPTLVPERGNLAWNVSPRLVSYFEVEILPPTKLTDDRASGVVGGPSRRSMGRAGPGIFAEETDDDDDDDDDAVLPPLMPRQVRHSKECVAVGLATDLFSMHTRMPGWDPHSWGYHGDDAGLFHGAGSMLKSYGRSYGCGDTVGCGVDWVRERVFFTLNGQSLGDAFDFRNAAADIIQNNKQLYPVVGIDTANLVRVNLTGPFMFDLHRTMSEQAPSVSATLRQMRK